VLPWISRVPIMQPLFVLMALTLMVSAPARADPPKVAVFDFELMDISLQGEVEGPRADEQGRLMRTGDQLRRALAESGKFVLLDIARSMLRRTAAICRPAAVATCNTRNSSPLILPSPAWFKRSRTLFSI